jgi:hypothetical protein
MFSNPSHNRLYVLRGMIYHQMPLLVADMNFSNSDTSHTSLDIKMDLNDRSG